MLDRGRDGEQVQGSSKRICLLRLVEIASEPLEAFEQTVTGGSASRLDILGTVLAEKEKEKKTP